MNAVYKTRSARRKIYFSNENEDTSIVEIPSVPVTPKIVLNERDTQNERKGICVKEKAVLQNKRQKSSRVLRNSGKAEESSISERETRQSIMKKSIIPLKTGNEEEVPTLLRKRRMTDSLVNNSQDDVSEISDRASRLSKRQKSFTPLKKSNEKIQINNKSPPQSKRQKNNEEKLGSSDTAINHSEEQTSVTYTNSNDENDIKNDNGISQSPSSPISTKNNEELVNSNRSTRQSRRQNSITPLKKNEKKERITTPDENKEQSDDFYFDRSTQHSKHKESIFPLKNNDKGERMKYHQGKTNEKKLEKDGSDQSSNSDADLNETESSVSVRSIHKSPRQKSINPLKNTTKKETLPRNGRQTQQSKKLNSNTPEEKSEEEEYNDFDIVTSLRRNSSLSKNNTTTKSLRKRAVKINYKENNDENLDLEDKDSSVSWNYSEAELKESNDLNNVEENSELSFFSGKSLEKSDDFDRSTRKSKRIKSITPLKNNAKGIRYHQERSVGEKHKTLEIDGSDLSSNSDADLNESESSVLKKPTQISPRKKSINSLKNTNKKEIHYINGRETQQKTKFNNSKEMSEDQSSDVDGVICKNENQITVSLSKKNGRTTRNLRKSIVKKNYEEINEDLDSADQDTSVSSNYSEAEQSDGSSYDFDNVEDYSELSSISSKSHEKSDDFDRPLQKSERKKSIRPLKKNDKKQGMKYRQGKSVGKKHKKLERDGSASSDLSSSSDADLNEAESSVSIRSSRKTPRQKSINSLKNTNKKETLPRKGRQTQQNKKLNSNSPEQKTEEGEYSDSDIVTSLRKSSSLSKNNATTESLRKRAAKINYKEIDDDDSSTSLYNSEAGLNEEDSSDSDNNKKSSELSDTSKSDLYDEKSNESDNDKECSELTDISNSDLCEEMSDNSHNSIEQSKRQKSSNCLKVKGKEERMTRFLRNRTVEKTNRIDVGIETSSDSSSVFKANGSMPIKKQNSTLPECRVVLKRINILKVKEIIHDYELNNDSKKSKNNIKKDNSDNFDTDVNSISDSSEDLDYEAQRQKNIREKFEFLKSLNIDDGKLIMQNDREKKERKKVQRCTITESLSSRPKSLRIQAHYPLGLPNYCENDNVDRNAELFKKENVSKKHFLSTNKKGIYFHEDSKSLHLQDILESHEEKIQNVDDLVRKLKYVSNCFNPEKYDYRQRLSFNEMQKICKEMQICLPLSSRIVPAQMTALAIHPNPLSFLVFAGTKEGSLGIWDVEADEDEEEEEEENNVWTFELFSEGVACLGISPNESDYIYATSYDSTVRRLNIQTGKFDLMYTKPEDTYVKQSNYFEFMLPSVLCISQDQGHIAILDCRANNKTQSRSLKLCSNRENIKCLSVHPVKEQYVITSHSTNVKLWDIRNVKYNQPVHSIPLSDENVSSAFFSPVTGKKILVSTNTRVAVYEASVSDKEIYLTNNIKLSNYGVKASWVPGMDEAFIVGSKYSPGKIEMYSSQIDLIHSFKHDSLLHECQFAQFHPTENYLVGANSNGKIFAFMGPSFN